MIEELEAPTATTCIECKHLSTLLVKSITTPRLAVGTHSVSWDGAARDGSQVPAGIYFYRLNVRDVTTRGKLIHLR